MSSKFTTISRCAASVGVPAGFLKREAAAGRIPTISAGRQTLANPTDVRRVLNERAKGNFHGNAKVLPRAGMGCG